MLRVGLALQGMMTKAEIKHLLQYANMILIKRVKGRWPKYNAGQQTTNLIIGNNYTYVSK
jgi:hypothetical protein